MSIKVGDKFYVDKEEWELIELTYSRGTFLLVSNQDDMKYYIQILNGAIYKYFMNEELKKESVGLYITEAKMILEIIERLREQK